MVSETMPLRNPTELMVSYPAPSPEEGRRKLRLAKSVSGSDSSRYLIPLPSLAPPGFHISAHPSGEVHLKSRDTGVLARGKLNGFFQSIQDGRFDREISSLIAPPSRRRFMDGLIFPFESMKSVILNKSSMDFALDAVLTSVFEVEFGDTRHLCSDITLLRETGYLRPLDTMMLSGRRPATRHLFLNLCEPDPVEFPEITVPDYSRCKRTVHAVFAHFMKYGGVFVNVPSDKKLMQMAGRLGLGGLLESFEELDQNPHVVEWKRAVEKHAMEMALDVVSGLRELRLRPPIRLSAIRRKVHSLGTEPWPSWQSDTCSSQTGLSCDKGFKSEGI